MLQKYIIFIWLGLGEDKLIFLQVLSSSRELTKQIHNDQGQCQIDIITNKPRKPFGYWEWYF